MRNWLRALPLALLLCAGSATAQTLREQIEAADRALFAAGFDDCDADAIGRLVTDDFEFFHDKWGQIARSKDEFVAAVRGGCERQRKGTDFKAKRQLVAASHSVYPMQKYGALQSGQHEFFRVEADGRLVPTEYARFTHLWKQVDGRWLLAKVISYDHIDGPLLKAGR